MIPVTRRAASSFLTVVRNVRGQVPRNATRCGERTGASGNVIVAQLGRRLQQTRTLTQTSPSRSALASALGRDTDEDIVKGEDQNEEPLDRPEHAVISTFDLFSIGGSSFYSSSRLSKFPDVALRYFSGPEQLTYRRPYEGWQYIYQQLERFGNPGTGTCRLM